MIYLILHKVRGEPAFDVAEKATFGDEEGWCISTSGHRAFPSRWWNLDDLADISDINFSGNHPRPATFDNIEGLPDHYSCNDRKVKHQPMNLLAELGLLPAVAPMRRI